MNTLKAVLRHLNKEENVELSSEKVELAALDDVNTSIEKLKGYDKSSGDWNKIVKATLKDYFKTEDAYKKVREELDADVKDATTTRKNTKGQISRNAKALKEAVASIKKAESAAKDLGIKVSDIPAVKELNKLIAANEKQLKDLNLYEEALGSFLDRHK